MRELLVIGGPTGVGKSRIACCVAERLKGEIISADSMCVYKGMDIGTAKPKDCSRRIKHHLIDVVDPGDYFDAKIFEKIALSSVENISKRGKVPLVVGGTYLYIQALLYGIEETPEPDWKLRNRLYRIAYEKGSNYLYRKLAAVDPFYTKKIHANDLRRIVRAIEVFVQSGKPFSSFHRWKEPRFEFVGVFLKMDWKNLSKRIEERVLKMMDKGLVDEVRELVNKGLERFLTSSQAIGYKELIPYLKGETSLDQALENIVKNTKEYAKRQIRWFKKQGWIEIDLDMLSDEEACESILKAYRGG